MNELGVLRGRIFNSLKGMMEAKFRNLFSNYATRTDAVLTFKNNVSFKKGESPSVLLRNFFEPEEGFVWSTSTWSEIIFSFSDSAAQRTKSSDLILDMDVFKSPGNLPHQTVKFYLNGLRIGTRDMNERATVLIQFDSEILKPVENVLTFDTPDASVPRSFGVPDERRLGVQLFSIQFRLGG